MKPLTSVIARCSTSEKAHAAAPEAAVWLKRLLVHMATLAEQDAHRVEAHPDTAIHALRKRMKKLLALLRLARPALSVEQFAPLKGAIRNLKRIVATQRDQVVMSQLLESLDHDGICPKDAAGRKIRRKSVRATVLTKATQEQLTRQASSLTDRLGRLRLFSLSWETVAEAYAKTYRKGHKASERSDSETGTEALHTWRKVVKDHYYQTLALYVWLGHPRRLRRTRRLSSLLGKVHDLDVFVQTQEIDESTRSVLEGRRHKLLSRIQKKGARVYAKSCHEMEQEVKSQLPDLEM
ncbi:CHAD domain-containing protein [Verrucomicrobium sp. BvORR106]|uniref:CHAD domain-containing protein n=1 Tax=Verrucomicrobium sp. BvORR106 TaxID=1403819 RepID=UPI000571C21A|nr:CHAD domain-containing protein [Verrucomicrobium sp. BvORR106]